MTAANKKVKNAPISLDNYKADLGMGTTPNPKRLKSALATALDIRKYEIDLYWRRAAYFWTFIAAAFVAFGTLIGKVIRGMRTTVYRSYLPA